MRLARPWALFILSITLAAGPAWAGANLWTSNGPANRGEIRTLAYVPGPTPAILVQRWPSLAARSTDNGATWTPLAGIPAGVSSEVTSFTVAPSDPQIVFAVWHDYQTGNRDIYKSTDGGASWTAVGGGPSAPVNLNEIFKIAVAPSDALKVFAATRRDGVYRSPDGGSTWLRSVNATGARAYSVAVDPVNPATVYQAGINRLLKSVDGGATWSSAATRPSGGIRDLVIDAANPVTLYAWSNDGAYKSTDGGENWGLASTGLPLGSIVLAPYAGFNTSLYFPPDAPSTLLLLMGSSIYSSTDGAATWTQIGASFALQGLLSFAGPLSDLFLGSYAGLQRSTDGGATFVPVPSITAGAFAPTWEIHGDPLSTSTFFVRSKSGFFMTKDDGMSWTEQIANLPSGSASSLFILPKAPNVWLVSTASGWFRSTDSGTTWNPSGTGGGRLVTDPFLASVIYGVGTPGVVISTDQGQTWTTYTAGLPEYNLQAVVVDPTTPGALFAAPGTGELFSSNDGGQTWAASATYPAGAFCSYVAVDPFDSQVIYVTSGDYGGSWVADVFKSTDRGATWSPIVIPGVTGSYINVIVADPLTPGTLYLATDNVGLWVTTNAGATWAPVNDGLPPGTSAQWFELHPGDSKKYLLASWDTGGGWSYVSDPTGSLVAGGGVFEEAASLGTWSETGTASVQFSPLSATPEGGSVLVTVGTDAGATATRWMVHAASSGTLDGILQACSPVDAGYTYSLGAKILIPSGQAQTGSGRVVLSWYSDATCSQFLSATETPAVAGAPSDAWRDSSLMGVRPPTGAVRGRLGLAVTVDQARGRFSVNFDEVTFAATCDGATAVVTGGGAIQPGGSATIQAVLTGLAPWSVTWSDGVVQSALVSPVVRTVSPAFSQAYDVASVHDAYCAGQVSGSAYVDVAGAGPRAAFVTGGGWITSPPGACVADPTMTGKATFGFEAKYHKEATVPTGTTDFQLHAAGLDFHASTYEWLVIAGAKAQYKGTGTINGAGSYGFMLTTIDGQISGGGGQDKLRIKIWDAATNQLIYDTQLQAPNHVDPTTIIGGGSIVVHREN
jgi:hypothetical protein